MKAKPNDMQAEQQEQPAASNLPAHTKARQPAINDKPKEIGAKLRIALQAIVWQGQDLKPAADLAGMHCITLRKALAKPHVIQFLKRERDVFTAHARAQNVHHAVRIRGGDNAAASMRAVDFIERVSDERTASGPQQSSPGMVIIIGHVEKSLNSPAKILELQAGAPPSSGDTTRQRGD